MNRNSKTKAGATKKSAANVVDPTIAHDIRPPPEPKFHGRIGIYYTDSAAEIHEMPSAPKGAPNVAPNSDSVTEELAEAARAAMAKVVMGTQ